MQNMSSRYDEIEQFLHSRIINEDRRKTREDWKRAIASAHKVTQDFLLVIKCTQNPFRLPIVIPSTVLWDR